MSRTATTAGGQNLSGNPFDLTELGGKRAAVRFAYYGAIALLGGARRARSVDLTRAQRIVFVCKGNICRSPFAEALAVKAGLPAVSAGTDADDGVPADAEAVRTARRFGIDLAAHRATNVRALTLAAGDLVVGFEPYHLAKLAATSGASSFQATLLGAWSRYPNLYIHDPYAHSGRYYQACFARIAKAVESLDASIKQACLDD